MKVAAYLTLAGGMGLFTALVVWQGTGEVLGLLAAAGWQLSWLAMYHAVCLAADALGWQALFPPPRPHFARVLWARWIADAVNNLLPVAQLGGEVARARAVSGPRAPGRVAGATVVVDITLSALTQLVFTVTGLVLLLWVAGHQEFVPIVLGGVLLFAGLVWVFYRWQRRGMFGALVRALAHRLGGERWLASSGGAAAIDAAIDDVYRRPRAVLVAAVCNLASWVLGSGEVWIAMQILGAPVTLLDAVLLESLGQAVRHAAFLVPAGLGIQEGGYLVLGAALGIEPDAALALSLAKRVRELLLGLPGLLAWNWSEGVRVARRAGGGPAERGLRK